MATRPVRRQPAARGRAQVPRMNRDRMKQSAADNAKSSGSSSLFDLPFEYWAPEKGSQLVRILPYVVTDPYHPDRVPAGELWYRRPMKVHWGVGPDEKARLCPTMIGQRCPICEYAVEHRKAGDLSEDELKDLKPKDRDLFLICDPANPDELKTWEISFHIFTKMLNREINEEPDERAGFADLVDGLDLKVRFYEKSMGTVKFLDCDRIDFLPRKSDPDPGILESIPALDDALVILSYKELEAEFFGMPAEDSGEQSDDLPEDAPFPDEQEEYYEDEQEVVEEEEPPPPPTRKRAPAKKAAPPARRRQPEPEPEPSAAGEECPDGGKYGEDCNALDACDTCDIWDGCQDEFNRLQAERRKARTAGK